MMAIQNPALPGLRAGCWNVGCACGCGWGWGACSCPVGCWSMSILLSVKESRAPFCGYGSRLPPHEETRAVIQYIRNSIREDKVNVRRLKLGVAHKARLHFPAHPVERRLRGVDAHEAREEQRVNAVPLNEDEHERTL